MCDLTFFLSILCRVMLENWMQALWAQFILQYSLVALLSLDLSLLSASYPE